MGTKLTLTVDKTVIVKAKNYAKEKGKSLSEIVENYLIGIVEKNHNDENEIGPITKSLRGSFKAPDDFDSRN